MQQLHRACQAGMPRLSLRDKFAPETGTSCFKSSAFEFVVHVTVDDEIAQAITRSLDLA